MRCFSALLLLLCSADAFSTTCIAVDGNLERLSEKYRDQVHFEFFRSDSEIDINIRFPGEIEGEPLRSATLYKGDVKNLDFDFMMKLKETETKDGLEVWYMVEESLLENNFIELVYSPECGPVIMYPVPHNQALKNDA